MPRFRPECTAVVQNPALTFAVLRNHIFLSILEQMDATETVAYTEVISKALLLKKDSLEKTDIPRLKEELRLFHISFSALYGIFLRKKLINEDPYKHETKITEIEVPDSGPLNEARRREQVSVRLSTFESHLDFLVNFYQFGVDFLNLNRIRKIAGLVRYIDWMHLSPDSKSPTTKVVAEIAINSKAGDQITLNVIGESLSRLSKGTATLMGILREISIYHRENYKLAVRGAIAGMQPAEANLANVKKKITAVAPGAPQYQEFIEEVIKEDFGPNGQELKDAVLKSLQVETGAKKAKPEVDFKAILIDGIRVLGSSSAVLIEIAQKIDENGEVIAKEKKSLWQKIVNLIKQMMNTQEEDVLYPLVFTDPEKGTQRSENLAIGKFRDEIDRKIKIFSGLGPQGMVMQKLKAMPEDQVLSYLEKSIRDMNHYLKILTALDEYFKSSSEESRSKIKGIKPELSSVKNNIVKANQLQHEYLAMKEEAEQMKKLGIQPSA